MKTVLVVTADSALQSRLLRNFASASVFVAATDADALKTLRIVDVDVVFRDSARPAADLHTFVARVKDVRPSALVVAIAPPDDATDGADISLPAGFSQRDLESAVRPGRGPPPGARPNPGRAGLKPPGTRSRRHSQRECTTLDVPSRLTSHTRLS